MFTYCLNNPVNLEDVTGVCANTFSIYLKADCGRSDCPTSQNYFGYTASIGGCASVTLGPYVYGLQAALVTDGYGDSELQFTCFTALDTGTLSVEQMFGEIGKGIKDNAGLSASAMLNMSFYNAPRVTNLYDMGYQVGSTYACGGGVGFDYNLIPDPLTGTVYHGGTVSAGLGVGASGVHGSIGNTFFAIPVDISVWDILESCNNSFYRD